MHRLTALVLATMLGAPAAEVDKPDFRTLALAIPSGVRVRVTTMDKKTIQGRITAITADGITLHVIKRSQVTWRNIPYERMKSIRQMSDSLTFLDVARVPLDCAYLVGAITWIALGG